METRITAMDRETTTIMEQHQTSNKSRSNSNNKRHILCTWKDTRV